MAKPYEPVYIFQAGERRLARVESIRGLASLALVSAHAFSIAIGTAGWQSMAYGERMFYGLALTIYVLLGLTGYLLAWPFIRQHFGGGKKVDLRSYALNRVLRLFPLYLFVLVVLLLLQENGGSLEQWALFPLLLQNFTPEHIATVNGPTWTVVVEWHFYIALPLLVLFLGRVARGSAGRAAAVVALFGAGSLALWITQVSLADGFAPLWRFNLPANFFFFAAGILLAFLRLHWERRPPAMLGGPLGSADVWLLASVPVWLIVWTNFRLVPMIAIAGFLMLGAAVLPLRVGRALRLLDWRPLAVVGVASYSLYVIHLPLIEHLREIDGFPDDGFGFWALSMVIAPIVALVSFRVIEAPFLRLRKRWSPSSAPIDKRREEAIEIEPATATGAGSR